MLIWKQHQNLTIKKELVKKKKREREKGEEDIRSYYGGKRHNQLKQQPEVLKMQLNLQKRWLE